MTLRGNGHIGGAIKALAAAEKLREAGTLAGVARVTALGAAGTLMANAPTAFFAGLTYDNCTKTNTSIADSIVNGQQFLRWNTEEQCSAENSFSQTATDQDACISSTLALTGALGGAALYPYLSKAMNPNTIAVLVRAIKAELDASKSNGSSGPDN